MRIYSLFERIKSCSRFRAFDLSATKSGRVYYVAGFLLALVLVYVVTLETYRTKVYLNNSKAILSNISKHNLTMRPMTSAQDWSLMLAGTMKVRTPAERLAAVTHSEIFRQVFDRLIVEPAFDYEAWTDRIIRALSDRNDVNVPAQLTSYRGYLRTPQVEAVIEGLANGIKPPSKRQAKQLPCFLCVSYMQSKVIYEYNRMFMRRTHDNVMGSDRCG